MNTVINRRSFLGALLLAPVASRFRKAWPAPVLAPAALPTVAEAYEPVVIMFTTSSTFYGTMWGKAV